MLKLESNEEPTENKSRTDFSVSLPYEDWHPVEVTRLPEVSRSVREEAGSGSHSRSEA